MDNKIQNNTIDTSKLQLSSIKTRMKAFIIDDLSITLLVMLILWDKINTSNGDILVIMTIMNTAFFQILIIKFIYQTFFVWYYGATIGKLIVKIRVIDFNDYGKVSLVNSAIRSAGRIVSEAVFYIGFVLANYTESRQTFHDKIGKTLVIDA